MASAIIFTHTKNYRIELLKFINKLCKLIRLYSATTGCILRVKI